jgi:hypothetical protein
MFDPFHHGTHIASLWTLAFTLFPITTTLYSCTFRWVVRQLPINISMEGYGYTITQLGYSIIGLVAAVSHATAVSMALKYPDTLFKSLFSMNMFPGSLQEKVLTFLKVDYLLTFIVLMTWMHAEMVGIHSIRRLQAASLLLVGSVILGPGATAAIAWSTREKALRNVKKKAL